MLVCHRLIRGEGAPLPPGSDLAAGMCSCDRTIRPATYFSPVLVAASPFRPVRRERVRAPAWGKDGGGETRRGNRCIMPDWHSNPRQNAPYSPTLLMEAQGPKGGDRPHPRPRITVKTQLGSGIPSQAAWVKQVLSSF